MNITVIMWRYPKLQIISSDRIALWRKPIHWLKIKEIQYTSLLLFAGYLDAATSMAVSSGGGGSDTGGWGRDKDEDELEWARRCAKMANSMCKRRKGLHR